MSRAIHFVHNDRQLEVRAMVLSGDWQIWVYENGGRIYLHSVFPFDPSADLEGDDAVEAALIEARRDVENETVIVPVIRVWPRQGEVA